MTPSIQGRIEVAKYLIDQGGDMNIQNIVSITICCCVCCCVCLFTMYWCQDGETALMKASSCGSIEIVTYLIDKGSNMSLQDNDSETALIKACKYGFVEAVTYLVENGADVNIRNNVRLVATHPYYL